jgi:K+-sensing histidine kinase KdpD
VAIQEAGESLESVILEAAREEGCGTVIVGYAAFPWLTDLVRQHLAEALLRKAEGLAIWVVR